MTGGDLQEGDGRPFGLAATLLPVAKSVDADFEGARELLLAEADEAASHSKRIDIRSIGASEGVS